MRRISRGLTGTACGVVLALLLAVLAACGDAESDRPADGAEVIDVEIVKAEEAVQCRTEVTHGRGNYDTGPEAVQGDAEAALHDFLEQEGWWMPPRADFVERTNRGGIARYEMSTGDRLTAVIMLYRGTEGVDQEKGWGVDTRAFCDPSEWAPASAEERGYQIWTDRKGLRAPTYQIVSRAGPEHCHWDHMTFLDVKRGEKELTFVKATSPELNDFLTTTYDPDATLPRHARDTGYSREGQRLWLTRDAAYLVPTQRSGIVARWPRGNPACA